MHTLLRFDLVVLSPSVESEPVTRMPWTVLDIQTIIIIILL